MHSFRAAIILALCGLLAGPPTAGQGRQTSETRTNALTNKDVLEMLQAGLTQEVVIAKIKSSACNLDTSPTALKELKAAHVPKKVILAMVQAPVVASPSSAQVAANAPAGPRSGRIQNIAPEEMWKRVTQCAFPTYSGLAFNSHMAGTVDIGLGISPEGDVANTSRVLGGPPLLVQSAVDAIREWKFRPNVVQGEVTWSRVRALVRFNADGTTAVDLAPAILADNFGDPGTPRSVAAAFPRPASSPECKCVQPWTGAEAQQLPTFKTPEDVGAFMQTYYLWPRAELIAGVVDALHSTGFLQKATAAPPIIGFFSEVFAANPDRLPQWRVLIAKQDEQTKAALERALSVSKAGGVRSIDGHSPELNDEYWGAFFASGNLDFLKKLVDQLHYVDERDDFYLFMTGVTAKWSLASNALSHILVRSTLETAKLNADRRTQELISELLAQGPERVKQEASEIIREQREAGKWAPQTGVSSAPAPATPSASPSPAPRRPHRQPPISTEAANRLEENLAKNPEDLDSRAKLLGFYFSQGGREVPTEEARQARLRHILWLIQHHPESELLGGSEATIDPSGQPLADADGYAKVKAAWLEQTEKHKNSAAVLGKAAWFFKTPDKQIAADLLKRAHSLEPQAPNWSAGLGFVYATGILGVTMVNQNRLPTGVDPELAKGPAAQKFREELDKSDDPEVIATAGYFLAFHGGILASLGKAPPDIFQLAEKYLTRALASNPGNYGAHLMLSQVYEMLAMHAASPEIRAALIKKRLAVLETMPASSDSQQRLDQELPRLAQAAFDAGEMEKAANYASESLRLAAGHPEQRGSDMAVHEANIVLGRVALRQNDVEKARACLLAAGHVYGDAGLSSFGPNMSLSKELLERGEKDVVLQYLELCKTFWTSSRGQLDRWTEEIKAGKIPEFGPNLIY